MSHQKLWIGLLLGVVMGSALPTYSYYTSYTEACELTAGDLEDIVEAGLRSELGQKLNNIESDLNSLEYEVGAIRRSLR